MKCLLLLPLKIIHSHPSLSSFLLLTPPHHNFHHHLHHHHKCHFPLLSTTPTNHLSLQSLHQCCKSKWDSNAESFRTQNSNFNFKNNKNTSRYFYEDDEVEEEDDDDEGSDGIEQWSELLQDYIDSIWILKVFGSYGWALPFILISMLLASGLKAFLMALALPLGQSTVSFAFQKIWGSEENRSKRKTRSKKKSRPRRSRTVKGKRTVKEKMGYQTWVPRRDVSADKDDDKGASSFGGWDELDKERDFSRGSSIKSDPTIGRSRKTAPEENKFSRIGRKGETPLLLRLLISVFPFLSSWTKML